MYRLEADKAYTIESDGSKYLEYRTLKKAVAEPVWYCQACKVKFPHWVQAKSHRESRQS
jgi:Zinc-finger of C2H2 type